MCVCSRCFRLRARELLLANVQVTMWREEQAGVQRTDTHSHGVTEALNIASRHPAPSVISHRSKHMFCFSLLCSFVQNQSFSQCSSPERKLCMFICGYYTLGSPIFPLICLSPVVDIICSTARRACCLFVCTSSRGINHRFVSSFRNYNRADAEEAVDKGVKRKTGKGDKTLVGEQNRIDLLRCDANVMYQLLLSKVNSLCCSPD